MFFSVMFMILKMYLILSQVMWRSLLCTTMATMILAWLNDRCVTQSQAFQINVSEFDMPVYLQCNLMLMDSTPVSFDGLEPLVLMFVSFVNIFFYINGSCFGDL